MPNLNPDTEHFVQVKTGGLTQTYAFYTRPIVTDEGHAFGNREQDLHQAAPFSASINSCVIRVIPAGVTRKRWARGVIMLGPCRA